MKTILLGAAPLAAVALIFGAVVLWDRLREPRRDPTRPMAVADGRTYRDAQRRIRRLLDAGDTMRARHLVHAIRAWLRDEVRTGRKSRRARRAADLEQWELRLEQIPLPIG
ncbi:hypothetical protein EV385_6656 [Krasilnikovia cinnamomea]|uniref:Uncharacterized protein n=1 Tax=Krasilnikovia cinnamomea TaxID=349313 RepID=A0A4Q7Z952_9ACTN|nr:hypothetical protein [Krasilnikovia cinnamomea]RZU46581.1 hypothetical protein EV385_6656 [Krasilnikovia cinnamomea]